MGKVEIYTGLWRGNLRETGHLVDLGADGKIILRWTFGTWDERVWNGSMWLMIWTGGRTCECGNESSGSIKCGEFHDYLKTGWLLKKDSAPWSKYNYCIVFILKPLLRNAIRQRMWTQVRLLLLLILKNCKIYSYCPLSHIRPITARPAPLQ